MSPLWMDTAEAHAFMKVRSGPSRSPSASTNPSSNGRVLGLSDSATLRSRRAAASR